MDKLKKNIEKIQNVQNIARNSNNQAFQSKVIVNGNMKKVISAAVPARY